MDQGGIKGWLRPCERQRFPALKTSHERGKQEGGRKEDRMSGRPLYSLKAFLGTVIVYGDESGPERITIVPRCAAIVPGRVPPSWLEGIVASLRDFLEGKEVRPEVAEWLLGSPRLTDFQKKVLRVVAGIPRGKTLTYGEVAARVGNPRAARAVGGALAGNPFPLLLPCHRVVRKGGRPGGYGPGAEIKSMLLRWEGSGSTGGAGASRLAQP